MAPMEKRDAPTVGQMDEGNPPISDPPTGAPTVEEVRSWFPRARRPDRQRIVDAAGVGINVVEWGEADGLPMLVIHGGFDFAETLNEFAPILASAGWRVVSWDHRGHGDSAWAHLYSWEADLRDAVMVLDTLGEEPIPIVGHSKGGALALQLGAALPHRFSHLINLDGLPSGRSMPDVAEHERTKMLATELSAWLDHRRKVAHKSRRPGTLTDLARRRGLMNNRLTPEWLQYLVTVGARESEDGWRWKIDPTLRMGGFGPWRPEWSMQRLPGLSMPVYAMLGLELEVMGWGTAPEDVVPFLPPGAKFEALEGVGHFMHIEQPDLIANKILKFIEETSRD